MTWAGWNSVARWFQLPSRAFDAVTEKRLLRKLAKVPSFSVAAFPEGTRGRLAGVVRPFGAMLEAPLTNRICVYYHVEIETYDDEDGVEEMASLQDAVRFSVVDNDHHAIVDPRCARMSTRFDHISKSERDSDDTPIQRLLLMRQGLAAPHWRQGGSLRFREAIIEPGAPIVIVGTGVREPDPDDVPSGLYREPRATRLWLRGSSRFPLVIISDRQLLRGVPSW